MLSCNVHSEQKLKEQLVLLAESALVVFEKHSEAYRLSGYISAEECVVV